MSYHTWSVDGFGFCVDKIKTTPEKVLKLAAVNKKTFKDLRDYLDNYFDGEYKDEELTMDVFDEFEGNYGERGLSCILKEAIETELRVDWADDFDCINYILFCPRYPWNIRENEKNLTEEDVIKIFSKYVQMLTDEPIEIDYYSVENGG